MKRVKTETGYYARTNITQSRRQKEILQVLNTMDGIANISSKEFLEAHVSLVEELANTGEATSIVVGTGSKLDKRTLTSTLDELEFQGKIKQLSTSLVGPTGYTRPIKIAYLVDTPQEKVNEFLANLGRTHQPVQPTFKILEKGVEYGGSTRAAKKVVKQPATLLILDEAAKDDKEKAAKLLGADDETIKASLLTEPNTVVQQYGFLMGKIARVRELHMHLLKALETASSSNIVSSRSRILSSAYLSQDLPIAVYAAVVSCRVHSEELLQLLSTPEGRQTRLQDLSPSILETFEINKARARTRMLDNLDILRCLGLITPLKVSDSQNPLVRCEGNDERPIAFDSVTNDKSAAIVFPDYWLMNDSAAVHLWAVDEENPPFYRHFPTTSTVEGKVLWEELRQASLDIKYCNRAIEELPITEFHASQHPADAPRRVAKLLRRQAQWRTTYNFSDFQKLYMEQYMVKTTAETPLQDNDEARLTRIATIVCAPKEQVARFYETARSKLLKDIKRVQKSKASERQKERQAEVQASLTQKAAEAKAQRQRDWDEMLARVHPDPLSKALQTRVNNIRTKFLQSSGLEHERWEAEIASAIQQGKIATKRPSTSKPLPVQIPPRPIPAPQPLPTASNERSVEELIAEQGPPLALQAKSKEKKKKGKGKEKANGDGEQSICFQLQRPAPTVPRFSRGGEDHTPSPPLPMDKRHG